MSIDARIDDLYRISPAEFVGARTALAKSLTGEDAKRVKALVKPTIVPWSVNQVYWHARDVYKRLLNAGEKLRETQLAALKGRHADVRGATVAHRQALGDAVKAAMRLAADAGAHPDAEQLARMFETLSLVKTPPEPHGRFTKPLQPQGFEALAGVAIAPTPKKAEPAPDKAPVHAVHKPDGQTAAARAREAREQRERDRAAAAAARQHAAAVKEAENALRDAQALEARAREQWERSKKAFEQAEKALADLRSSGPPR